MSGSDGASFVLHARVIGTVPNRESDLLPSSLLTFVFGLLAGACAFRFWRPPGFEVTRRRPQSLTLAALGCVALAIGFGIRAGLSNTAIIPKTAIIAEQVFLLLGFILLADAAITLTRDMIIFSSHSSIQFTILARVLLVASLALNIAGYSGLVDPQSTTLPAGRPTSLILAGSFRPRDLQLRVLRHLQLPMFASFGIVVALNLAVWITSLYLFLLVAVTDDSWYLTSSVGWFYVAFGFFLGVSGVLMAAVNFERFFGPPRPWWFWG